MSKENQNWLHDLFISEAKAAQNYHNRGAAPDLSEYVPKEEVEATIGEFAKEIDELHEIIGGDV